MTVIINAETKEVTKVKSVIEPLVGEEVREIRDRLLSKSDWTQIADAPVDKTAWAEYRQKLRDVPQQSGFPAEVDWPVKPQAPTS